MDLIVSIIKPEGITSYDVIRVIKRVANERKIGHLGTLDPMASGVLPLFLGKMTKLIPHFNNGSKIYRVKAELGTSSTTFDREGEITQTGLPRRYSLTEIQQVMDSFLGEIEQVPPIYSAIKVEGRKLYEYARAGEEVKIKARKVVIHWVRNIAYKEPELSFEVHCSKGTYIRTLANDVAKKLGTTAYLKTLERSQCGDFFKLTNSIYLDLVKKNGQPALLANCIAPDLLMTDWHKIRIGDKTELDLLRQGNWIKINQADILPSSDGELTVKAVVFNEEQRLIALGRLEFSQVSSCIFQPSKVFI